ncbi:penicillin-binding protein 1A [Marinomonas ostreistagni]|uniref:penicillin-binding protein 1A n=1 Tax=Marinomonas ostreistagni TaxID=359209 RepID=UPI00194F8E07|nr:penicillin-binding protein 1A [Marinomonas ostreistagni]MBM6550933.1 penicillin-binding protein 1A [Marinomonas ostreistagni]
MAKTLKILLILFVLGALAAVGVTYAIYTQVKDRIPTVEEMKAIELQIPLRIYTRDEQLIGEFGEQRRTPLKYEDIPKDLENAVLAAEDSNFYHHPGVDVVGLLRAVFQLVTSGEIQSGGSTITMQVARNYFLSFEQTFMRKFTEIFISLKMEQELSKHEILELYMNKIYLGKRAYGFDAAAQVYYGKHLSELDLAQYAMIAGLPKAPSRYNPVANPSRALIRRNWILQRMLSLGMIEKEAYQAAVETPVTAKNYGIQPDVEANYVAEMVRHQLYQEYGDELYTKGFTVYTTINSERQKAANKAIYDGVLAYDERHGYRGTLDTRTGLIDAPLEEQTEVLQDIDNLPEWRAALVLETNAERASVRLENGDKFELPFAAMEWAAPYINENYHGKAPTSVSDVMVPGDIIQLRPDADTTWRLTQMPTVQSALVSLDSQTGAIESLVGGFNYFANKFNRITQSKRQPGSNFKPFIYSSALDQGYTASTVINDAPVVFHDTNLAQAWRPTNDGGKFYGPTRLRQALYRSQNVVSVRLLDEMGIRPTLEFLKRFGFDPDELPHNLSLSLGSANLSPMQVASGYTVFSNGGFRVEPYFIDRIEDRDGEVIFEAQPTTVCRDCSVLEEPNEAGQTVGLFGSGEDAQTRPTAPRVLDEEVSYIIYDIMRDVIRYGTGRRARVLDRDDIAGKTGTTNDGRDAWFSGFNGDVVTTVWTGFDDMSPLGRGEWGGSASLPTWINYMRERLDGSPVSYVNKPSSLVTVRIDPETGERAYPGQDNAIFEIFRPDHVPTERAVNNNQESNGGSGNGGNSNIAIENLF